MQDNVSNRLANQQAGYKLHVHKIVQILLKFAAGQEVYANLPLPILRGEQEKASVYSNELVSWTRGPLTIIDVKNHVITIDENGILNTTFLVKALPPYR